MKLACGRLRLAWLAIFLLAFGLRLGVVWQYSRAHPLAEHLVIDEAAYDRWAGRIAAGEWREPTAFFQEPLYSYLLGLLYRCFGRELMLVRVLQAFVGALTALCIGAFTRRVFGTRAALLSALAFACYRPALLFPALLLKPVLFLALTSSLTLALLRAKDARADSSWLLVGFLAGLGALVRGNLFVLGPLLCAWPILLAWRENASLAAAVRRTGFAALAWLLTLAPASWHNLKAADTWMPTSGAGTNFAIGNSLANPWGRPGELDFVRGIPEYEAADWQREAERRTGLALGPAQVSRFWLKETLRSMWAHPREHLSQLLRKLRLSLSRYEVPDNHHLEWDARYVALLRWPLPGFCLWGVLGLAGLMMFSLERKSRSRMPGHGAGDLAALLLLYLLTIVLTMTSMRIRLGLVPWLLPFAAYALEELWRLFPLRKASPKRLLHAGITLAVATLLVHWPTLSAREREEDLFGRDYNLAVTEELVGDWRSARALALRLDRQFPGTARLRVLLARCDFAAAQEATRAGDEELAQAQLSSALAWLAPLLEPPLPIPRERHRAEALAGRIAFSQADWQGAELHLQRALEFAPEESELALLCVRAQRRNLQEQEPTPRLQKLAALAARVEAQLVDEAMGVPKALFRIELAEIHFAQAHALLEQEQSREAEAQALRSKALQELKQLVEDVRQPPEVLVEARLCAAVFQAYLGRKEAARNHLQAVLALDPNQPRAHALLQELER